MYPEENADLLPYNTFHLPARARYLVQIDSVEALKEVLSSPLFSTLPSFILGGGSNVLFTGDYPGLVMRNVIHGVATETEDDDHITLRVGAGESWHPFVEYCVDRNYGGVENLSLIPGTVGAAPMQNIGAYGVEIRDTLVYVEAMDRQSGAIEHFANEECRFGYRESVFKNIYKDLFFITAVGLRLSKRNHRINIQYGALQKVLGQKDPAEITIKGVSEAVIGIRRQKLPDPAKIGNAGSFFKNPVVDVKHLEELKARYPGIPAFAGEKSQTKIPAGWLIEQCGWKGKTFGSVGVHRDQALVLVHYGGGHGDEVWQLAMDISESVNQKFGILLHPEVNKIEP